MRRYNRGGHVWITPTRKPSERGIPSAPVPVAVCPRRQCRGRAHHSPVVHWFGWLLR